MLAIQLKELLKNIPDESNILIFTSKENTTRQLLMNDFDKDPNGNIVIDAEYDVLVKTTLIKESKNR